SAPLPTIGQREAARPRTQATGGAMENGTGVNLAILNCSFTGNQVDSGGGPAAEGGAIDNSIADTIMISDSQFIGNTAIGSSVGANAWGGALDNFQTSIRSWGEQLASSPNAKDGDFRTS